MKAKLKIDYYPYKAGSVFNVVEIFDRFICLDINGRKTDFGKSEVKIIAPDNRSLFLLGKELWFSCPDLHIEEIKKKIKAIADRIPETLPITKGLAIKSINVYLWD